MDLVVEEPEKDLLHLFVFLFVFVYVFVFVFVFAVGGRALQG